MKLTPAKKYIIAASLGAVLCFGAGYGVHTAMTKTNRSMDAAVLNADAAQKRNFNEESGEAGAERSFNTEDHLERIQEFVSTLDDETKEKAAAILGLSTADLENLDASVVEKAMEAMRNLSEEDRQSLMELVGKEGFGMKGMKRGAGRSEEFDMEMNEEGMNGEFSGRKEKEEMNDGTSERREKEEMNKEDVTSSATSENTRNKSENV